MELGLSFPTRSLKLWLIRFRREGFLSESLLSLPEEMWLSGDNVLSLLFSEEAARSGRLVLKSGDFDFSFSSRKL